MPGIENDQRNASRLLIGDDFRAIPVGAAQESIVRRKNDNSIVGDASFDEFRSDHAKGDVHCVDLLVVFTHNAIVIVCIAPLFETRILPSGFTLLGKVFSVFSAIVLGFFKNNTFIN